MRLLACTDKGLIEFESDNSGFQFKKVHFLGQPAGYIDIFQGEWRLALNHRHWGPKIQHSQDLGNSWEEIPAPKFPTGVLKEGKQATLNAIWTINSYDDGSYYVGVEPAAIFRTVNNGKNYEFMEGLWNHPTRESWVGGGKGSNNPFLHHILIEPGNKEHLYAGISCAGVLESRDMGKSWSMINEGLKAAYLPNPGAEAGHDPHCIKMSGSNPAVLWQQNHCGVYRSGDGGNHWEDLTPNVPGSGYGFSLVTDPGNDSCAWIIPCESDSMRIAPGNSLAVYMTDDSGKSWKKLEDGLPKAGAFDIVLRHSFDLKNDNLVFGTNNGNLYHSDDRGEHWKIITQNLSTVRCVRLLD